MDVHDVGDYKVGDEWRVLEPGMVLTVEPGLYIAAGSKGVARKWWNIGVRIEDDVLVTRNGHDVLSKNVPKQVDEKLLVLKGSLEEQQQEKHTADIILKILNESLDENYLEGLGENLVNIVALYLEDGSYRELNELCALLERQGSHADSFEGCGSSLFIIDVIGQCS